MIQVERGADITEMETPIPSTIGDIMSSANKIKSCGV